MARGNLYELQSNVDAVGNTSESDFYDYLRSEFENIKEAPDPEAEVKQLWQYFHKLGMPVGAHIPANEDKTIYFVDITDEGRKNYFADRFRACKQLLDEMTFENFMDTDYAYKLCSTVEDTYGDAVTMEEDTFQTFDDFMRTASGRYYIGNIFYMK